MFHRHLYEKGIVISARINRCIDQPLGDSFIACLITTFRCAFNLNQVISIAGGNLGVFDGSGVFFRFSGDFNRVVAIAG